jgi:hypothetical protein
MEHLSCQRCLLDNEIRVLEHEAVQGTGVLACRTKIQALPYANIPAEPFSALSYVWGDPAIKKPLMLDGLVVHVTSNLYSALFTIWSRHPLMRLWVDALCIRQDNIAERNQQVLMMGDIFGLAENVIVWLGEALAGGGRFWAMLERWTQTLNFDDAEYEEELEELLNGRRNALAMGLDDLVHRPWFTRAWTYQEIRLACGAVAFCGSSSMPWNSFVSSLNAFQCLGTFLNCLSPLRTFLKEQSGLFSDTALWHQTHSNEQPKEPLFGLMKAAWSRDATDPRDKIYAFISPRLTSTPFQELRPDYGLDMQKTFIKFARTYINRVGSLEFLMFARGTDGASDWVKARPNERDRFTSLSRVRESEWVQLRNLVREPPEQERTWPPLDAGNLLPPDAENLPTWVCDWRMTGMQLEVTIPNPASELVFDFRRAEHCLFQSVRDYSQSLTLRICVIARVCGAYFGQFLQLPYCSLQRLQQNQHSCQKPVATRTLPLKNVMELSREKAPLPCNFIAHFMLYVFLHDLEACDCDPCYIPDRDLRRSDEIAQDNPALLMARCSSTKYPKSQPHTGDWLCLADGLSWPVILRPFAKPSTAETVRSEIGFKFVSVCPLSAYPSSVPKWLESPCVYGEAEIY